MVLIGNDWDNIIGSEFEKGYYKKLHEDLNKEIEIVANELAKV